MTSFAGIAPAEEYQNEILSYLLRQRIEIDGSTESVCIENLLYATAPSRSRDYEVLRVAPGCVIVRGEGELALMGVHPPEGEVQTDADMFYLSAERAVVASGSALSLFGRNTLKSPKPSNTEKKLPPELSRFARKKLEELWVSSKRKKNWRTAPYPNVKLNEVWKFKGLRPHPKKIIPRSIISEEKSWQADLEEPQTIARINIILRRRKASTRVELSNDDFKEDIRPCQKLDSSTSIVGPIGKSFFFSRQVQSFRGREARFVRVSGYSIEEVELLSREEEPARIVELKVCDLQPGDNRQELLVQTRDNQLLLLGQSGELLWRKEFTHNIITVDTLVLDKGGRKDIFVVDASSALWRFSPDGELVDKKILRTSENIYRDFFRFNRAYALGVWRPHGERFLMMGTYQSLAWIKPDGQIVCYPEKSDELPYRSGFVWRGLVY